MQKYQLNLILRLKIGIYKDHSNMTLNDSCQMNYNWIFIYRRPVSCVLRCVSRIENASGTKQSRDFTPKVVASELGEPQEQMPKVQNEGFLELSNYIFCLKSDRFSGRFRWRYYLLLCPLQSPGIRPWGSILCLRGLSLEGVLNYKKSALIKLHPPPVFFGSKNFITPTTNAPYPKTGNCIEISLFGKN